MPEIRVAISCFVISLALLFPTTISASDNVIGNNEPNIEIKAIYSNGLEPRPGDSYCINYKDKKGNKKHIGLDASLGIKGFVENGNYTVFEVGFVGSNENAEFKELPVAFNKKIEADSNYKSYVLAIGETAIKKAINLVGEDNLHIQSNSISKYDNFDTPDGIYTDCNPQPFMRDLAMFQTEEEKLKYIEQLEKEGIVDENFLLTDKGKQLQERYKKNHEPVGNEVISSDDPLVEKMENDNISENNTFSDSSMNNDFSSGLTSDEINGNFDAKVKYFDQENIQNEVEKTNDYNVFLKSIVKYFPIVILIIGGFIFYIWYKKKML